MRSLPFVKMEGAGNDYVYVDGFSTPLTTDRAAAIAARLADRHFGVGGDGLIVLAPSERADCRMLMWNADGSRSAMCGNGLRCLAKLAHDLGHVTEAEMRIECDSGVRTVELLEHAGAVAGARVLMDATKVAVEPALADVAGQRIAYHRGDAGNPHAVVFVADVATAPVAEVGAALQTHADFDDGVNVEFVAVRPDGDLDQRTWERGSGETMACGSGATVAALAALVTGRVPGPRVTVHLPGGTLTVIESDRGLVLEGPARTVFRGEIALPDGAC